MTSHREMTGRLVILLPFLLCAFLSGCSKKGGQEGSRESGREGIDLTVTYEPQKWIVERIAGGGDFRINVLLPSGSDPETYSPTVRQIHALQQGGVWLHLNTIGFEQKLLSSAGEGRVRAIDVSEGIEPLGHTHCGRTHSYEEEEGGEGDHHDPSHRGHGDDIDPHLWSSVRNTEVIASNTLQELIRLNPAKEPDYRENYRRLSTELQALDSEIGAALRQRHASAFMVNHPSLGYFARDYGLRQIAMEAEGKQPSVLELRDRLKEAREAGARAIVSEPGDAAMRAKALGENVALDVITINLNSADWLEEIKKLKEL